MSEHAKVKNGLALLMLANSIVFMVVMPHFIPKEENMYNLGVVIAAGFGFVLMYIGLSNITLK